MSVYQAEKLIDLACSTTHEEEARTAALTACRLIRKHGMRLSVDGRYDFDRAPRSRARPAAESAWNAPAEPPRQKPPNGGIFKRATRTSRCESCGGNIASGDEIYVVSGTTWCRRH
jgi:hypothetical protein